MQVPYFHPNLSWKIKAYLEVIFFKEQDYVSKNN
jgi:hypothetical protein